MNRLKCWLGRHDWQAHYAPNGPLPDGFTLYRMTLWSCRHCDAWREA